MIRITYKKTIEDIIRIKSILEIIKPIARPIIRLNIKEKTIKLYNKNNDCIKDNKLSYNKLKELLETGDEFKEFIFKYK